MRSRLWCRDGLFLRTDGPLNTHQVVLFGNSNLDLHGKAFMASTDTHLSRGVEPGVSSPRPVQGGHGNSRAFCGNRE